MRLRRWAPVVGALSSASMLGAVACDLGLKPYVDPAADSGAAPSTPGPGNPGGDDPDPLNPDVPTALDAGTDAEAGTSALPKRVFVTSTLTNGALGGAIGADGICQLRANAVPLNGTFIAWLSVTGKPAVGRVAGDGPWYFVDRQTLVFANRAAMTTPGPAVKIDRDERGAVAAGAVWTGTLANGIVSPDTCSGWGTNSPLVDGLAGSATQNTGAWTQADTDPCSSSRRLYCIEQ